MGLHWRICFLSSLGLPLCIFSFVSFVHLQSYSSFAFTFYFLCIFFPFFVSFFLSVFCSFSIFFFYCSCTWFLSSLWTCRQKSTFGCFFHLIFAAGTFGFCQSAYNIISNFCLLYSTYTYCYEAFCTWPPSYFLCKLLSKRSKCVFAKPLKISMIWALMLLESPTVCSYCIYIFVSKEMEINNLYWKATARAFNF